MGVSNALNEREKKFIELRKNGASNTDQENRYLGQIFDLSWILENSNFDHINQKKSKILPLIVPTKPIVEEKKEKIYIPKEKEAVLKDYPKKISIDGEKSKSEKELEIKNKVMRLPHKKILFVTDFLHDEKKIFNEEQSDLFEKMILAMHLNETHYHVISLFGTESEGSLDKEIIPISENVMSTLFELKPLLIITFGSKTTFSFLGKQERLTRIHGQFIERTFHSKKENFNTRVVPLFHLDFLLINNNMKKVFWTDLQKVMKFIGK